MAGSGVGAVGGGGRMSARDWAELLRVSALFTVPGDALAGAAASGLRPNRRTLLAIGSSLCLYEAGMALNDWADRAEDAIDRPHRPLPSGRIAPGAALAAAGGLTVAGLALAARAGRPAQAVAGALAASVWSYDLGLKRTALGPAAMATARSLDLLLGATATGGRARTALPSAALLGAHTLAVTSVSRHETQGGSVAVPVGALAATVVLGELLGRPRTAGPGSRPGRDGLDGLDGLDGGGEGDVAGVGGDRPGTGVSWAGAGKTWSALGGGPHGAGKGRPGVAAREGGTGVGHRVRNGGAGLGVRGLPRPASLLAAAYVATAAKPLFHAALNPSPPLTQRAVGGGIRAMIPLQAALAARTGALGTALATAALAPLARRFGRKVSVT
ncbi:UbiA family prenyltransferase [Streptomyces sp. NBC_01304]|nr:UbiA family prenyltransferase [Streptomyces sp. NBC_01304]